MQMPFGRHKGQEIKTLPPDYLEWLRNNMSLTGQLADEIDRALGWESDPNRTATCRAALVEMVNMLTDRQVMRVYGFTERLLGATRPN